MARRFYQVVALGALLFASFSLCPSPARASCDPPGSPSPDFIICSGTDTNGVAGDGGNDNITVSSGALIFLSPFGTQPKATGVDAGADQDTVFNIGAIVAQVVALVVPVPVPPALVPGVASSWDGSAKADAEARGIDGGTGTDTITSAGSVSPSSSATVLSASVPGLVPGVSDANVSSTANAESTAIDGGDGNDSISNSGSANTDATATAAGVTVALATVTDVGGGDKSKVNGDVQASAGATGLAGGAGDDTVTNSGSFDVTSSATTLAADGGGVAAGGSAAVSAASAAATDAAAINLGGGNDTLDNHAAITATADSSATALNVTVGDASAPAADNANVKSATDGGATANASATGIAADGLDADSGKNLSLATDATGMTLSYERTKIHASGDDNVTNDAAVSANATSITHAPSVGVAVAGAAAANAVSTADSGAVAIDLGGGNDTLTNGDAMTNDGTHNLTATADSTANALGVAVGVASAPSDVDASASAKSRATGIAADGLEGDTTQSLKLVIKDDNSGSLTYSKSDIRASGDDRVTNYGNVSADATSTTHNTSVGVTIVGAATTKATSEADSGAVAVDLGGGNDQLVNSNTGQLAATATSTANAVGVNVGIASAPSNVEASASAQSRATGIAADGLEGDARQDFSLSIQDNNGSFAGSLTYSKSDIHASGADNVTNDGAVTATATSTTQATGVGVSIVGGATVKTTSKAESGAAGVDLGGGNDILGNTGVVSATADSTANAVGVNVGIAVPTAPDKLASFIPALSDLDASTSATSHATGIAADGLEGDARQDFGLSVQGSNGSLDGSLSYSKSNIRASGDDHVTNDGIVAALASSATQATSVGVTVLGAASAKATSESDSGATAIDLGGGDDTLTNTGVLAATSDSTANAVSVGVGVMFPIPPPSSGSSGTPPAGGGAAPPAAPSVEDIFKTKSDVDASATAKSRATGIAADGLEGDTSQSFDLAIQSSGGSLSYSKSDIRASGDDNVTNDGIVAANAAATTRATGVGVTIGGDATAKATSEADSGAVAVDLGGGDDTLMNNGALFSMATSEATSVGVSVGATFGVTNTTKSSVDASASANSRATGIAADSLEGDARQDFSLSIQDNNGSFAGSLTYSKSDIRASGDDNVTNNGVVSTSATSTTHATSVGVTVGEATAKADSKADAGAVAIDLGGGNDTLTNTGQLTATSNSTAQAVGVNVGIIASSPSSTPPPGGGTPTPPPPAAPDASDNPTAKSDVDASASAKARATGIAADSLEGDARLEYGLAIGNNGGSLTYSKSNIRASGNDNVTNFGSVDASATSTTPAVSVGVTIGGEATAKATSEADSGAVAIDLGGGNDTLMNTGALVSSADSHATAVGVTVGGAISTPSDGFPDLLPPKSDVDASASAQSRATGIAADSLEGDMRQDFNLSLQDSNGSLSGSLTYSKSNIRASGDDQVTNSAYVNAAATSTTPAVSVGVMIGGATSAKATSEADSGAVAVDLGGGHDRLVNNGGLTATATADATAVSVGVGVVIPGTPVAPVSIIPATSDVDASASAKARATGIAADSLEGDARLEYGLAIGNNGGSLTYSKSNIRASGNDNVTNNGAVNAITTSTTHATSVGVMIGVEASAKATSEAESDSVAVDLGGGSDRLVNIGQLTASADSIATAVGVAVGVASPATPDAPASFVPSESVVDASAGAQSRATGIAADSLEGDARQDFGLSFQGSNGSFAGSLNYSKSNIRASGDDQVTNNGSVTAMATSTTHDTSVGVTLGGASTAKATSEAESGAVAVDLGGGNDSLMNIGALTSTATSDATAVGVAAGVATSTSPVSLLTAKSDVDASASAKARATGIAADSLEGDARQDFSLSIQDSGGTPGGSLTYSKSEIRASGDDNVTNNGAVNANATSTTRVAGVGVSIDGGTATAKATSEAESGAVAIDLGGGNDTLTNTGQLTATGNSTANALGVAVGVDSAKSDVDASASAQSRATGIAADSLEGDARQDFSLSVMDHNGSLDGSFNYSQSNIRASGDDAVTNSGAVTANATSTARAASAGVSFDNEATAKVTSDAASGAVAVELGGGNDTLTNVGQLTATADSSAYALGIAVGGAGEKADVDAGTDAKARATGIAADSLEGDTRRTVDLSIEGSGDSLNASLTYRDSETHASGDDNVINSGAITAQSTATTLNAGVGVSIGGEAASKAASTSEAEAVAVDLGGGNDALTNTGALASTATADATAMDVAVGVKTDAADADKVKSAAEASVTASSRATGIAADGVDGDTVKQAQVTYDRSGPALNASQTETYASGNDSIANSNVVNATATSTTLAAAVGVTINGEAAAKSTSTAESAATAIDLGGGNDTLTNNAGGTLTASATSDVTALNVAVGVSSGSSSGDSKSKSAADGSADASATAIGIAADGVHGDTQQGLDITLNDNGLTLDYSKSETHASGDDVVHNDAAISAGATSIARSASVGVTVKGAASAESTSSTDAHAAAVELGGGSDTLDNSGNLTSIADSTSNALKVAVSTDGRATSSDGLWHGGTKAEASAAGIDAAGGASDTSTNATLNVGGSGIHFLYEKTVDNATTDGNDNITNNGNILAQASATANAANVSVSSEGTAAAVSHVEAEAAAVGIKGGNGDDEINNLGSGQLTASADAHANAGQVSVSGKGVAVAADALWDGGTQADSSAVGIDADGGSTDKKSLAIDIDSSGATVVNEHTTTIASGNDRIVNEQAINASATTTVPSIGVSLEAKKGLAASISSVDAQAESAAIRGGSGADDITNRGRLTSTADAQAGAANVAIAKDGVAAASDSVWDGGTTATASAVGIDADGGDSNKTVRTTLTVNGSGAVIEHRTTTQAASGNDTVLNEGDIDATATALSGSASVGIVTKGVSVALSQSTATSDATAIHGGDGADTITNHGKLTSSATSTATGVSVAVTVDKGVALAGNASWDGGVTAEATATGIAGDGGDKSSTKVITIQTGGDAGIHRSTLSEVASGNDVITNTGEIDATAHAIAPEVSAAIAITGVSGAVSTATATSNATAIDAGAGDDRVTNTGKLNATASSVAVAVNGAVATKGVAISADGVWNGGTQANATAKGIDGGDGNDNIDNGADIDAHATAVAPSVSGSVAVQGVAGAISASTATSSATAIDGGDGNDTIHNTGKLTSTSVANADGVSVAVTTAGVALAGDNSWDGGVTAEATAKGIDAGPGNDTVLNEGEIDTHATAVSPDVAISVAMQGVGGAVSTSTATARSTGIDASAASTSGHGGSDTITNRARITSSADATAVAVNGSVTTAGVAISADGVWNGGTHADATALGIQTGGQDDTINNDGEIDTSATAVAPSISGSVAVSGVAGAISAATATSNATAIDGGAGNDTIHNTGKLTSTSVANADAVSVAVTTAGVALAGDNSWDGGVTADATAKGIDAGTGFDSVLNEGEIDAHATAVSPDVAVSVAVSGAAGAVSTSTAKAQSSGIDASADYPDGADVLTNKAKIASHADATAVAVNGSVTTAGVAISADGIWDGGTHADAGATGIHAGMGNDSVANDGEIDAGATSVAPSISGAVAVSGVAGAISAATATSNATAIDANDGNDSVNNTAKLTAKTVANADGVSVSVTAAGVAVAGNTVWDGGVTSVATSRGIDGGKGQDDIANSGDIDAGATAVSTGTDVSVAVAGLGSAISAAKAEAQATAIDGGDSNDTITNTGKLTATSLANTDTVAAGISVYGVGVAGNNTWDDGTSADARSTGIYGGTGRDFIDNGGEIVAQANAVSPSVGVGFDVFGVSGALTTATARSHATAIDAGDDSDQVHNTSSLTSNADATGIAVNAAFSFGGVSGTGDSVWDGGTTAEATAKGIDGGLGQDRITNEALIETTANSTTLSNSDTVSVFGVAGATSSANSTANATAIDGGGDADVLTNSGELKATSNASATGVSVAVTAIGASVATDSFWNGGTKADATSKGIDGGTGNDQITDIGGPITADATGETNSVSVSATGAILAAASASSTSTATADAIDGGDGNDTISNDAALVSKAKSSAGGVSVSVALAGGAVSGSPFDNATQAEATANGIEGGAGDDTVHNAELSSITLDSHAIAKDTAVSVGVIGFSGTNSGSKATARATGIDGGDGNDVLDNQGAITGTVTAEGKAHGISVTLSGAPIADASTTADAGVTGIAGGAGDDSITNSGAITLVPHAESASTSVGISVAGLSVTIGDASASATSSATAIDGGQGNNSIVNRGVITETVTADGTARNVDVAPLSLAFVLSKADTTATSDAAGIRGGDDGDNVSNENTIDIAATSTATASGVSVTASGVSRASARILPGATAVGIDGGGGNDSISNTGDVLVTATSDGTVTNSSWSVAGVSGSDSGTIATATATGLAGDAGDDFIENLAAVGVTAGSNVTQNGSSFAFGGVGGAGGTLTATGTATAIGGGDGADNIHNEGTITVGVTSALSSTGGSITPFGTSQASTTVGANAAATGIDGGAGDDAITNLDTIDVTASSSVTQNNSSFTFGGTGASGGSLAATTRATGISGGDGSDDIRSESAITVNASSSLSSSGGSTTPFGTSQAGATVGADTEAAGIDGGAGDDAVMNLDAIDVTAGSTVTLGGTSFSLGGTGNAGGSLEASSRAAGIAGGAGQDQIQNLGTITVNATSDLDSQSGSNVGFGTSDTGGSAGAATDAVGLDGGSDDDFLNNLGSLDVTANSTVTMTGSTYTFGGTGSSAGTLAATTRATGIAGGDGADRLRNQGDVTVQATSTLDNQGNSSATFGTSSGGAISGAVTEASGLDGGAGDNDIENLLGTIDVNALTTVTANKAAYTFGGTASTGAVLEGAARASGISAGDGANSVRNAAAISAAATSHVTATGGTKTTFGGTSGSGTATADADARGIDTGAGVDLVMNSGTITANAVSDGTTSNSADAGWITGSADTDSNAKGTAAGYGISAGDGDNALQNDGDINVMARGTGYAFAYADGAHLSLWSGDGQARANSQAGASATGILAGNGRNQIVNNKAITVLAQATTVKSITTTSQVCPQKTETRTKQECTTDPDTGTQTCTDVLDSNGNPVQEVVVVPDGDCQIQEIVLDTKPTYAAAHGNGFSGNGNASSTGNSSAEAYGIKAGDGDNLIVNNGDISVTVSPEAKAIVSVSAGTTGDATGSASASASATAYGIWAGNGDNEITNSGALTVTAAPKAQASADIAAGKGICIPFLFWTWCIADGTGTGTASATFDSLAVGIRTGDGNNRITNNGTLSVSAKPETDGAPVSVTAGIDNRTLETHVTSQAVGIQTGDGDNQIVNNANGVVDVEATDVPGYGCSPSPCSVSATGIQTGDGDNVVVNDGTITTSVTAGGSSHADVAIRTGGGSDMVELGNGSTTLGGIALNAGDDSLTFIGSAKLAGLNDAPGSADGGAGTDSLYFNGAGSFTGGIQNFENAAKDGAGTFVLSSLPTMQQLQISQGTLQTNSAYSFASGGSYQAWIYGGGDLGKLLVNNGTASLAGNLAVNKGHGAYINGTAYDVVEADQGVTGGFSDVLLPVPSPLLHFSYAQTPNAAQVEANVASFTTMATNSVGMAVATYLDTILPTATGDLSDVLGQIQSLPAEDLPAAYASLSPDTFSSFTQAAAGGIAASTGNLQQRMQAMRLGEESAGARSASLFKGKPVMLAYDGSPARIGGLLDNGAGDARQGMYGLWANAFGQLGDQDSDNTHAGFDYNTGGVTLGFDHDFTRNVLAGVSLGYSRTNLHLDRNLGDGDINATVFSAYGSYFTDKAYVEATLSHGSNHYANARNILISGSNRVASSYHDGSLLSGTLGGGYYFKVSGWTWEPFASVRYSSLDEESFEESGAGAVGLRVDARRTQYLSSDLGLRFRRMLEKANGMLVPELSLAWNHDFGLDDRLVTAAFTGVPTASFSVEGQDIARNGARLGGGVAYVNRKGLTSSLNYGAELRNGYVAHSLIGELRYEFK